MMQGRNSCQPGLGQLRRLLRVSRKAAVHVGLSLMLMLLIAGGFYLNLWSLGPDTGQELHEVESTPARLIATLAQPLFMIIPLPGKHDISGRYWIVSRLLVPSRLIDPALPTLVTHCSPVHLYRLKRTATLWAAPISVAIFVTNAQDVQMAVAHMMQLVQHHENVASRVTFSWVMLASMREAVDPFRLLAAALQMCDRHNRCQMPPLAVTRAPLDEANYGKAVSYPGNLLRNVARDQVRSAYFLSLDIDLAPFPASLPQDFVRQTTGLNAGDNRVFVIPAFECDGDLTNLGSLNRLSKNDLQLAHHAQLVQPFYFSLCPHCHAPTQYQRWWSVLSNSLPFRVDYFDPWEPFFFGPTSITPAYDTRFENCRSSSNFLLVCPCVNAYETSYTGLLTPLFGVSRLS